MKVGAGVNVKGEEERTHVAGKVHFFFGIPESSANNLLSAIALAIVLVSQWLFLLITDLLKLGEIERPSNRES